MFSLGIISSLRKRFGVAALACLFFQLLYSLVLTATAASMNATEKEAFSCYVDPKIGVATRSQWKLVEQACLERYDRFYNSHLPLYGFALLSIGLPMLVTAIYSLSVGNRVNEIEALVSSYEPQTNSVHENQRNTVYVFYSYFYHLVVRSVLGVIFCVLQLTYFYPINGFEYVFVCSLPSTVNGTLFNLSTLNNASAYVVNCVNPSASEKRLLATMLLTANILFACVTTVEVIYLCPRLPFHTRRFGVGLISDVKFVTTYFLKRLYLFPEHQSLPEINIYELQSLTEVRTRNGYSDCIDFYKRDILHHCLGTSGQGMDGLYVNSVIYTGTASHRFSNCMTRHEIYDVHKAVPSHSIAIETTQDLFNPNYDTKGYYPRRILVIGRPGIGKSTLAEKILHDWANNSKAGQYYSDKICFLFRLRWFNDTGIKDMTLKTFLRFGTALSEEKFESIYEEIAQEPQKAVLIFDGLDEFYEDPIKTLGGVCLIPNDPNASLSPIKLFTKLLIGHFLKGATVLTTSRPIAFEYYSKLSFDRQVEIMGFTSPRIKQYVTEFCHKNRRSGSALKIWNYIKSSLDLLALCYIPVNCFIVCAVLSQIFSEQGIDTNAMPVTLTELYEVILDYCEKHHHRHVMKEASKKFEQLSAIAFKTLQRGALVFDEECVDEEMKRSFLLNSLNNPIFPLKAQFCFLHLTIQEFLAARHVTETQSSHEIKEFILAHVGGSKWHLVLQFIAGLLGQKIKMLKDNYRDHVWAFAESLEIDDGEIELNDHNIFVMKCLREADNEEVCEAAMNEVVEVHNKHRNVSTSDWSAITFVCKHITNFPFEELMSKENPGSWEWEKRSKTHEEKFIKLLEYGREHPEEIKNVSGVRVCFSPEFCIHKGSDGTQVYVGLGKDGYEMAVKRLPRDDCACLDEEEKKVLNEPNITQSDHVVKYWFLDEDSDLNYVYLISDLYEENLKEFVESSSGGYISSEYAREIIQHVMIGLADLHRGSNPVLHRDLKPSNIFRDVNGKWLLTSFGMARVLTEGVSSLQSKERGTKYWRAAESCSLNNVLNDGDVCYKKESDIQVAGMLAFYVITKGEHPFGESCDRQRNLLDGNPVFLDKLEDPTAKDLISWMLSHDPKDRPSAKEALNHPYLQPKAKQFELVCRVGNQREIKMGDVTSDVVRKLNSNPKDWKSSMSLDVLQYLSIYPSGKHTKYGSSWTECLRLIRNVNQHWYDIHRALPKPEAFYIVGSPQEYFLNLFPNLPVEVHRVIRSCDWKERAELKDFFSYMY